MPPNEKWRSFKIVDRSDEIVGGIKNALEKGQNIVAIKQSFINAGYTPAEVNASVQKVGQVSIQPVQASPVPAQPTVKSPAPQTPSTPKPSTMKQMPQKPLPKEKTKVPLVGQKKPAPKILIISLIIVSALILIGAAVLGLYWDKFFG